MEPEIVQSKEFTVVGLELKTTTEKGKNFREIPQFWHDVLTEGLMQSVPNKKHAESMLGICMDFQADGSFSYVIGVEVINTDDVPITMVSRIIPAGTYAKFTAIGPLPHAIQDTVKYIYREWLPESGYCRADAPDFELYDERVERGDQAEVDIYVPIIKS